MFAFIIPLQLIVTQYRDVSIYYDRCLHRSPLFVLGCIVFGRCECFICKIYMSVAPYFLCVLNIGDFIDILIQWICRMSLEGED